MSIKWNVLAEQEKRKFEKMNEAQRFIYFLLKQFGSPYGGGRKTLKCPIAPVLCAWRCMWLQGFSSELPQTIY